MEATLVGQNRTGAAIDPKGVERMLDAVDNLSPPVPINTRRIDVERQEYITEAERIGSIPPTTKKAPSRGAGGKDRSVSAATLLDKLGERIAFERAGTRLYTALISKHLALLNSGGEVLPRAVESESPATTLQRIRDEELRHFHLLCNRVTALGGDPTAQTPSADVTAAASSGLIQVVTDPRTTLAQSLNAVLTAELTDNAGWELLIQLATEAGEKEMVSEFSEALEDEQQHLEAVRGWLQALVMNEGGTPAV
jgi:bacterioferritin (cytochrome b1)